jgi:hypothetical protein
MSKYSIKKSGGKKTGLEGLTEYNVDNCEDIINKVEFGIKGDIKILKKMNVNEYIIAKTLSAEELNTNYFHQYIKMLNSKGIDIGKGESEYGYKMPLPNKKDDSRKLIIFRRR